MKWLLTIITLCLLSAPVQAGHQPDGTGHDIAVKVNGLVCDFCAQAITTLFREQAAVENVYVDLDHGFVTVDLKDQQSLSDETIKTLITDSGYSIVEIRHTEM